MKVGQLASGTFSSQAGFQVARKSMGQTYLDHRWACGVYNSQVQPPLHFLLNFTQKNSMHHIGSGTTGTFLIFYHVKTHCSLNKSMLSN